MKLDELKERAREDETRFTAKVVRQLLALLNKARSELINANAHKAVIDKERTRTLCALLKANEEIRSLKIQLGRDRRRKPRPLT